MVPLQHLYAERYLYPASWGLMSLAVVLIFVLCGRYSAIQRALLCTVVGVLLTGSALQNRHWKSDETLFGHAIEQVPLYVEGRIGLAVLALSNQQFEQAVQHGQTAIASVRDSDHASYWSPFVTHTNLGLALQNLQRFCEAHE